MTIMHGVKAYGVAVALAAGLGFPLWKPASTDLTLTAAELKPGVLKELPIEKPAITFSVKDAGSSALVIDAEGAKRCGAKKLSADEALKQFGPAAAPIYLALCNPPAKK